MGLTFRVIKKLCTMLCEIALNFFYYFVPYRFRQMKDLSTEVALVTGSGQGLGRQLALRLVQEGAKVVLWDDDKDALDKTLSLAKELNPEMENVRVTSYVVDVSDRTSVYENAVKVKNEVGSVTLLVNCTDVVNGQKFMELDDEKILRSFDTNALSQVWVIKAFLPDMMSRGTGHLVSVPGSSGLLGSSNLADYTASKHAVVGLIESLRLELAVEKYNNILTTLVFPYSTNNAVLKRLYNGLVSRMDDSNMADEVLGAIKRGVMVHYVPEMLSIILMFKVFVTSRAILAVQRLLNGESANINKRKNTFSNDKRDAKVFENMH